MKEQLKNSLTMLLNNYVDTETLRELEPQITLLLSNYNISSAETGIVLYEPGQIPETVKIYIVSKKIAGLSTKSLYLYSIVLRDFFQTVQKAPKEVRSEDIKLYLFAYKDTHNVSNRTLDTRRTIICSYFSWMASEGYIDKNPAINIQPIKYERKHKKPMTQIDLEKIRSACKTKREKAIVEMLYSTGARISEIENLNIKDVNFETKEVYLYGKGDKHRISYLNAKAEIALKEYLEERKDSGDALFVYEKAPYGRLKKPGIEAALKKILGRVDGLSVHVTAHVFRHTMASRSIECGMDLVSTSKLLGHSNINTTMVYITTESNRIKQAHQTCVA